MIELDTIGLCEEHEIPLLMEFIDQHWKRGHVLGRDEELLRWQYAPRGFLAGHEAGLTSVLARFDGKIVGMMCASPCEFSTPKGRFSSVWLSNWLVLEEYRRHRFGLRFIWYFAQQGFQVRAGIGSNAIASAVIRKLKDTFMIPDIPRWIGVFDPDQTRTMLAATAPFSNASLLAVDRWLVSPLPDDSSDGEYEVVGPSANALAGWEEFWNEDLAPSILATLRDAAFLRWRYLEHPRFTYTVRFARNRRTRRFEGLVVYRIETVRGRPERVMRIMEFLASPVAVDSLVREVIEAAVDQQVSFADFYCTAPWAARGLERVGFAPAPGPDELPLIPSRFQPLEADYFPMSVSLQFEPGLFSENEPLMRAGHLYVTKADGDQDRPA
jgi:hypothetical protein